MKEKINATLIVFFLACTSLLANNLVADDFDCESLPKAAGSEVSGIEAAQVMLGAHDQLPQIIGAGNHSVFSLRKYELTDNITLYSFTGAMTSGCTRSNAFSICIKRETNQPSDRPSFYTYKTHYQIAGERSPQ